MKFRTDFVTNSSSANYSVTLELEGNAGQHAEIRIHTYDFRPWYKDSKEGCETYDREAYALSYDAEEVAGAQSAESVRELCDILLSAVHEYGWGVSSDWWQESDNAPYFRNRWLRDRLLEERSEGKDGSDIDLSEFDLEKYLSELRKQGKQLDRVRYRTSAADICAGWSFAIWNCPSIYDRRKGLERYIIEHGGTVDEDVTSKTDFVIFCDEGIPIAGDDEVYWMHDIPEDERYLLSSEYDWIKVKPISYVWRSHDPWMLRDHNQRDSLCSFEEYVRAFIPERLYIDAIFSTPELRDISGDERLDLGHLIIPEHEFVRRFDPKRERTSWMPYNVAHPLIVQRFADVCEARGITPKNLKAATYKKHIGTFGDSARMLGFDTSDCSTRVDYSDHCVDWTSRGDDIDIDEWYLR